MLEVEFLTDKNGPPKAVVIPFTLWRQLLPRDDSTIEELSEALEDYCMNKAIDEGRKSRLLSREEALTLLEEEPRGSALA